MLCLGGCFVRFFAGARDSATKYFSSNFPVTSQALNSPSGRPIKHRPIAAATINSYLDYFTAPPLSLLEISG